MFEILERERVVRECGKIGYRLATAGRREDMGGAP